MASRPSVGRSTDAAPTRRRRFELTQVKEIPAAATRVSTCRLEVTLLEARRRTQSEARFRRPDPPGWKETLIRSGSCHRLSGVSASPPSCKRRRAFNFRARIRKARLACQRAVAASCEMRCSSSLKPQRVRSSSWAAVSRSRVARPSSALISSRNGPEAKMVSEWK